MVKAESKQKGKNRFYPCPKCGDVHPSITTLLDVMGSRQLMGWMAKNGTAKLNTYTAVARETLKEEDVNALDALAEARWKLTEDTAFFKSGYEVGKDAADYGTMAHAWIEAHLQGKEISLEALPPPAQNSVKAMLEWEKEHHLETIKTEQTFYNCRLNYAGTADWVGRLDSTLSLGDWKTSAGIYFNYVVQGWGYALADETEYADRLYSQIFIGRFGKDGTPEVKIYKRNEFPSIETARDVLIACGHIFKATQEWEAKNPYIKKAKEKITV